MIQVGLYSQILLWMVVIVGGAVVLSTAVFVGRARLRRALAGWRTRLLDRLPLALVFVAGAGFVRVTQELGTELSWLIGFNVTSTIYAIEGNLVPAIQSVATPAATAYFAFVYVYGFAYLLAFPFVAYAATEDARPFRELVVAYVTNNVLGLVGYTLFVAFGPRNHIPELVDSLLFANWPAVFLFTAPVTSASNAFPSLHTSLSVTVALLAWRTRDTYPAWAYVSTWIAASIVVATMYLGIHWAVDVVAGLALAYGAVRLGARDPLAGYDAWARHRLERLIDAG